MAARATASADPATPATPTARKGGHYYLADAAAPAVMRCIGVLKTGQAVLVSGDDYELADAANLRTVPTTVGDVKALIGEAAKHIGVGNSNDALLALTALRLWAEGAPAPAAER